MAIKAILFDADGVVIFPWRFASLLENEWGITRKATRPFFRGSFNDCLVGKADLKAILPPYLQQWGWTGMVDDFVKIWLEIENAPDRKLIEAILSLRRRGYLCGLATSQERYRAEYMKTAMRFSEIFDRLFFSCEIGAQKPDPAYYAAVMQALGLAGDAILLWDDNQQNVETARLFGWQAEIYMGYEAFAQRMLVLGVSP